MVRGTFPIWKSDRVDSPRLAQRLYLAIAAPTIILLCFLIGPFEVADEPAHYLRMVSVAEGHWFPVVSPPDASKKAAGTYEDIAVAQLASRSQEKSGWAMHHHSFAEVREMSGVRENGTAAFAASPASIYPPFLYAGASTATAAAKALRLPPFWYLYVGRLANALIVIFVIQAALLKAGDASLALFACAILPMNLYQSASVSADALLLPLTMVFAVMLLRIERGDAQSPWQVAALAASTVIISVGKVAYLPFALLPPLATRLVDKAWSRRTMWLMAVAVFSLCLWLAWAGVVHDKVFSIRPNVEIDPKAQFIRMLSHPLNSIFLFANSMLMLTPKLVIGAVGSQLGWGDLRMPWWSIYPLPFFLVAAGLPSEEPDRRLAGITAASIVVTLICYSAVFVLLYVQYNEVGAPTVDGVQGRYFMPLAILLVSIAPKLRTSPDRMKAVWAVATIVAIALATVTLAMVHQRYW